MKWPVLLVILLQAVVRVLRRRKSTPTESVTVDSVSPARKAGGEDV